MRVLIFAAENWEGSPFLPRCFQEAGAWVALCCPRHTFISTTRFRDRFLAHGSRPVAGLVGELDLAVRETKPDLVVPGDDLSLRVMMEYVALGESLGADSADVQAVSRSLPDREHYHGLLDKFEMLRIAEACGLKVAPYGRVQTIADALEFAEVHGYPVVVKPDRGAAGQGVAVCCGEDELAEASSTMRVSHTVSKFIEGEVSTCGFAAFEGRLLAGLCALKTTRNPHPLGPACTVRIFDCPQQRDESTKLVARLGYTGFGTLDSIVDPDGVSWFLEVNARPAPGCLHVRQLGLDLAAKLLEALGGNSAEAVWQTEGRVAFFPQERVRAGTVEGLPEWVPYDDPELLQAFCNYILSQNPAAELPQAS